MKTVFMGTPEIAVPALRALAACSDVITVVTQPDRPAGRGQKLQPPPVKVAALELGLRVWQPETLRGAEGASELQGADRFVVMAYGELLRQRVLDLPPLGCVNLHASLLPRWRGASPLQAVLRAGDAETGVSVMRMVRALDAGPVYLRRALSLAGRPTLPWLHDAMATLAADALTDFLRMEPIPEPVAQDETLVTVCGKLTAADGALDWRRTRAELDRWVRAYTPAPGCWVPWGGERLRILALEPDAALAELVPGTVRIADGRLLVAASDGWVAVNRLQTPGKRALDVAEWLRGNQPPAFFASFASEA